MEVSQCEGTNSDGFQMGKTNIQFKTFATDTHRLKQNQLTNVNDTHISQDQLKYSD